MQPWNCPASVSTGTHHLFRFQLFRPENLMLDIQKLHSYTPCNWLLNRFTSGSGATSLNFPRFNSGRAEDDACPFHDFSHAVLSLYPACSSLLSQLTRNTAPVSRERCWIPKARRLRMPLSPSQPRKPA